MDAIRAGGAGRVGEGGRRLYHCVPNQSDRHRAALAAHKDTSRERPALGGTPP